VGRNFVARYYISWHTAAIGRTDFREIRVFKTARLCKFGAVLCICYCALAGDVCLCFFVLTECGRPEMTSATEWNDKEDP